MNAIATARNVAMTGSRISASTGSPRAPIPSEVSVTPSCMAAMKRGGRETIFSTCWRAAIALLLELDDLRPARGHEAVLGGDEKRVQEQQPGDGGQLEEDRHAPVSPEA